MVTAPALECTQTETDEQHKFFENSVNYGERVGARLTNGSNWQCVGNVLGSVTFWLDKVGSPTGTVYCRVWRDGTTDPFVTMGSIDVSTLPTSAAEITFNSPDSSYTLVDADIVACEYTSGDDSNHPRLGTENSAVAGVDRTFYTDSWQTSTSKSCYIKTQ